MKKMAIIAILVLTVCSFAWGGGVKDGSLGESAKGVLDRVLGHSDSEASGGPAQPDTTAGSDEVGASGVQDSALPEPVTTTSRPDQKTLTITGLSGKPGRVTCFIFDYKNEETVAIGYLIRKTSASTVMFPLLDYNTDPREPWIGSGSYSIELWFDWDGSIFGFSDGKTWPQLGINSVDDKGKQPPYTFSSIASTIDFSRFRNHLEWHN